MFTKPQTIYVFISTAVPYHSLFVLIVNDFQKILRIDFDLEKNEKDFF